MSAVQQDPTPDLNPETLQALSSLMLAQAQEIFVVKSIHGKFEKTSDFYLVKLKIQNVHLKKFVYR